MAQADYAALDRNPANHSPLTPIAFLKRSAYIHPDKTAVIDSDLTLTYRAFDERCRRLASALADRGIGYGDTVAVICRNTHEMLEARYAIPMLGAVMNPINTRLDAATIGFILEHGDAKLLICDHAFGNEAGPAVERLDTPPEMVVISSHAGATGELYGEPYEDLIEDGDAAFEWEKVADEWDALTLLYTSGTTGDPKGVVYHHRGGYLAAMSNAMAFNMTADSVYLWTLPMFHCNGWCFAWTLAAKAGTNVCLRQVAADPIIDAMTEHGVTHYCGAPIVHSMLINADENKLAGIKQTVYGLVAGAAPPAAMIEGMERIGFKLTHVYGLTETYGPAALCAKHEAWDNVSLEERVRLNGRQGVRYPTQSALTVVDQETGEPVPHDGETLGELVFAGNIVMKGYLKNPSATDEAFADGWYHTGDLGYVEPDGYIKIADRAKDVIISGGENISSLEVESVLSRHPAIAASAVVARPDEKWGETPCAFIELRPGEQATEDEIIAYCRERLAKFKCPKTVVFGPLPTTSTGKVQKYELRSTAEGLDG